MLDARPQRLPSGIPRVRDGTDVSLVLLTKSTCDRAKQLSKAHGEIWAPGASLLVSPSLAPM